MRTLVCLLLIVLTFSIDCTGNQYAVSVTKKSGSGGALETYTISGVFSGETRVLANGVAVPAGTNSTQEFCLDATTDGIYSIELKHSNNGLWSVGSYVTVKNVDGVTAYSGSLTSSTKSFQFTLKYIVEAGGPVRVFQDYEEREWWSRDFVMDSSWVQIPSTSVARTVEGVNLNRFSFDLPNFEKYSHVIIRLYYKYGILVFVNGVRYYVDNISSLSFPDNYGFTIMEMATSQFTQYTWKEILIPAHLLYSTNNAVVIALTYEEYDEYQESMTFSVMGVYASLPDNQCSPLPVEASVAYGLKEDYSVDALFDGNMGTQSVFRGATMHVTTTTSIPAIISEYSLYRAGESSVKSWKLSNCGTFSNGQCTQWRLSSNKVDSHANEGSYTFSCDENTNLLSQSQRLQLLTLDGSMSDVSLNELTLYACGMTLDASIYSNPIVDLSGESEFSLTPDEVVAGATYSIAPALPASVEFNPATGAISGSTADFGPFTTYTVVRNNTGIRTKFYLTILTDHAAPTQAPTEAPTQAPTQAPTEPVVPTEEPTEAPKNDNTVLIICIAVAVVVIVIIVVVVICCSKKKSQKTMPTKALPVV